MTLIGDIVYPDTFVSHYDRVLPETREDFNSLIANANAASRAQRAKDRRHQWTWLHDDAGRSDWLAIASSLVACLGSNIVQPRTRTARRTCTTGSTTAWYSRRRGGFGSRIVNVARGWIACTMLSFNQIASWLNVDAHAHAWLAACSGNDQIVTLIARSRWPW